MTPEPLHGDPEGAAQEEKGIFAPVMGSLLLDTRLG